MAINLFRVLLVLVFATLPWSTKQAEASYQAALQSVVAVLPVWDQFDASGPTGRGAPRAPEGSGVAVFEGGYIATNQHVLGAAKVVRVGLPDGRVVDASIIGRDVATDIALLKIDQNLPVLIKADPPTMGEPACALGNQFGLGMSLSCGIVAAYPRTGTGFNGIEDFIQTDAAINPGSSGGALLDDDGRLIGLVSAIFASGADTNIGVNFAASSALLYRVVGDLKDYGRVQRARSGLRLGRLSLEERRITAGAKVMVAFEGQAGAAAGLTAGDIITKIDDRAVLKPSDAVAAFALKRPGDAVAVHFMRGGEIDSTELTLAAGQTRPQPPRN